MGGSLLPQRQIGSVKSGLSRHRVLGRDIPPATLAQAIWAPLDQNSNAIPGRDHKGRIDSKSGPIAPKPCLHVYKRIGGCVLQSNRGRTSHTPVVHGGIPHPEI